MTELIRGITSLVLLSVALGQYPRLERWARHEAMRALVWEATPPFFPGTYRAMYPNSAEEAKSRRTKISTSGLCPKTGQSHKLAAFCK